jgi:hypothetical protein
MTDDHNVTRLSVAKPRGVCPIQLESDMESISRLAGAVWLIGQLVIENHEEWTDLGPSLKQLAEEIQDYTKRVLAIPNSA